MAQPCRTNPRAALAAAVLGVALGISACGGSDEPAPSGSISSAPSAPATGGGSTPTGPMYDATGLDLCGDTDRKPLDSLSLKVEKTDATPPRSGPGAACLFDLRPPDGQPASLRVEATTLGSAEEASRLYRATQDVTSMTPDGPVAGVDDEAEGFAKQSDPGYKYAEYFIHARRGNLVVKVWLAVGGEAYAPKDKLAAVTLAITKGTLERVPKG